MTPRYLASIWAIVWKTGLFFVLWGMLLAPFIVPFAARFRRAPQPFPPEMRLYIDLCTALTVLAAAWVMARFLDRRSFVSLGFAPRRWCRDLLAGLGFGAAWLTLSAAILWFGGWAHVQSAGGLSGSALSWAGTALLFNTVAQEVLARSYVFQTIESNTNSTVAVIVSAILFMLYHAGPYQGAWLPAFNVFAAGILFGVAYLLTGNLWLPIGIHFIWNLLLGPVLGLSVSGSGELAGDSHLLAVQGPAWVTAGSFGVEGGSVVTCTTMMGIGALFLLFRGQEAAGRPAHAGDGDRLGALP